MTLSSGLSIAVSGYKCFGETPVTLSRFNSITVLIGRNNAGKSSFLDALAYAINPKEEHDNFAAAGHGRLAPELLITQPLTEPALRQAFRSSASGGPIRGNHWEFGKEWIGRPVTWRYEGNKRVFVSVDPACGQKVESLFESAMLGLDHPFNGVVYRRLRSDRNVSPEADSESMVLFEDGRGLTRLLTNFLTRASLPSDLVEKDLVKDLNSIYEPDASFSDIQVQRLENQEWEIYLGEPQKGRIPLSRSGSGLKTILLVLACVHLIPHIEAKKLAQYIFAFEELENNLHPALQRRLGSYLRELCEREECKVFLTTHSNVLIDQFANDRRTSVVHVTHDGNVARAELVRTYVDHRGILDDLDVRASDLLQSNGIIWVEGPSDRLYVQRWIALFSSEELKEGTHYQTVFYGGRLLAHLSADAEAEDVARYLHILTVNRNALVVIDSDRSSSSGRINATKRRIRDEVTKAGGIAWVTAGREIENYLPTKALKVVLGRVDEPLGRYERFSDYLLRANAREATRFAKNKSLLAERLLPHLTLDDMRTALDWDVRMKACVAAVRRWNGEGPKPSPHG
ncbi:MAG TPA: ATP-binding protein [Actinomycetota bacterium]